MKRNLFMLGILVVCLVLPSGLSAQEALQDHDGEYTYSMGLPSRNEFYIGPMLVIDPQDDGTNFGGQLYLGWKRLLANPLFGINVGLEGYGQAVDNQEFDGGGRIFAGFKPLYFQAGGDYSINREDVNFIFSLALPLRRGGLLGRGSELRVDWLPARNHTFNVGFQWFFGSAFRGKTRPRQTQVRLPKDPSSRSQIPKQDLSPELEQTLEHLQHAVSWIYHYTVPFFDDPDDLNPAKLEQLHQETHPFKEHLNLRDNLYPFGHTVQAEITAYHQLLEQACFLALGGSSSSIQDQALGRRLADQIRSLIFHEILVPYNRLLGRSKYNQSLLGYGARARAALTTWLETQPLFEPQRQRVLVVLTRLIDLLNTTRREATALWGDSALVWIPLQYGLHPQQYDTRQELDQIVELLTGEHFSDANQAYYVMNEQFQVEVAKMILRAEDYHVLWIHDYRGFTPQGTPDQIAFVQTVQVYLAALTERVRAYDTTGTIPTYLIFLDQMFYEANTGHYFLRLLQDPLHYRLRLPSGYEAWQEELDRAQEALQTAVAESTRLQAQATTYGKDWLRNRIKIHVNITNPSDFSFRNRTLFPGMLLPMPDNLVRDHRKISFYDITEQDPGKGEALFGGMGIGEHYAGPTWEDRAILVQGPVLLPLKEAARQMLMQQGFSEEQIPVPLREQPTPANYAQMVNDLRSQGWDASVMQLHNQTGFFPKAINPMKAALYSLMPPGSTLIVPDSLWNAPFWAGLLAGAALRGCQVLVIAPALENAPSAGFPQMSRAHELFTRLILIQDLLREEFEAVGGMLKVGIYDRQSPLGDLSEFEEFREHIREYPFLQTIFPFRPEVYRVLNESEQELRAEGYQPTYLTEDIDARRPKLHLKLNVLFSQEVREFLAFPGWETIIRAYLAYYYKFVAEDKSHDVDEQDLLEVKDLPETLRQTFLQTLETYADTLPADARQRAMVYLMIGSQNMDYRGMTMDGEVMTLVSSRHSLAAVIDLFFISGLTTWVDDRETLDELLPPASGWKRSFGRYIMKAL